MAARRKKSKRRRRKKRTAASLGYTIIAVVLFCVALFLVSELFDLFAFPPSKAGNLTVQVQNGCGAEGIGQRTADHLRELGLDVVDYSNADSFDYTETMVVDRTGDMASAVRVAKLIDAETVIQQIPATPLVDVIVVVGADYKKYLGS